MFLCKCKTVYMDGTFKYYTKFWLQLFMIHAIENGHYVPTVFCLLWDKTVKAYLNLFNFVFDKCYEKQFSFRPERFVVDFEMAIHNAIIINWPYTLIQGWKFHLAQACHRKNSKAWTKQRIQIVEGKWNWKMVKKNIFGLTYLNPDNVVGDCFAFSFTET